MTTPLTLRLVKGSPLTNYELDQNFIALRTTLDASVVLTSSSIAIALGYTPYNAANPAGYITSAALPVASSSLPLINGTAAVGSSLLYARQDHVHPIDTTRAPLVDAHLTGIPTVPTAATGTNTTQAASCAFVNASVVAATAGVATFNTRSGAVVLSSSDVTSALTFTPYNATNPSGYQTVSQVNAVLPVPATNPALMDGSAGAGSSLLYARQDHVHPTDTSRAPVANAALTGIPTAPTASHNTSSTQIATTAFARTGTTTNDNAPAGQVGEYIISSIASGSAVSLTSGATANVTSISLTAGDWDITGLVQTAVAGTTTTNIVYAAASLSSAAVPGNTSLIYPAPVAGAPIGLPIPSIRVSVNTTTTVYLVVAASFSTSTCAAYGFIAARRAR